MRRNGLVPLGCGLVAGTAVGLGVGPGLAVLSGYDAAALVFLARVWLGVWPMDAAQTAAVAAREDPRRATADLVLLAAAVASLGAIAGVVVQTHHTEGSLHGAQLGLGAGSVVVSWVLVHTIFALKYARLYYGGPGGPGGVEFDGGPPAYADFAYLAFTLGMTFQVSDTDLRTSAFRRLVLRHSLLSYLFGAVILAATINLVASLAG